MKRYRIEGGIPTLPPVNGVNCQGKIISNFKARIENDSVFASENGYFPLAPEPEILELDMRAKPYYVLENGLWVKKFRGKMKQPQ